MAVPAELHVLVERFDLDLTAPPASHVTQHDRMLELRERPAKGRIGRERTVTGAQIKASDRQMVALSYEPCGLTRRWL